MHKCIELLPCDWLIYLCYQSIEQVYLIKWPVSEDQTAPTSHDVWEGFKNNSARSSKNNLQHIQLSDMTATSNGTGFYAQMKLNMSLLAVKHSRWVWVNTGIYSTPCVK